MTTFAWIMWAVVLFLVLLPPKYDPAIMLREWLFQRKPK